MVLGTPPGDLRHMALHQQAIDILVRVPSSALMDGFRTLAQRQRRNTVVLRDHDVSPLAEVDQRNVHCVSASPDNTDLAIIRVQNVIRVTQQHHGDTVLGWEPPFSGR